MKSAGLPSLGLKLVKLYEYFCTPLCKKYKITQSSFNTIIYIADNPELNTARDMSQRRGMKTAIISVAVDLAVNAGYLNREADPKDRRIQRLTLTDAATPLVNEARTMQDQFEALVFGDISQEELTKFLETSNKLIGTINSIDPGGKKL